MDIETKNRFNLSGPVVKIISSDESLSLASKYSTLDISPAARNLLRITRPSTSSTGDDEDVTVFEVRAPDDSTTQLSSAQQNMLINTDNADGTVTIQVGDGSNKISIADEEIIIDANGAKCLLAYYATALYHVSGTTSSFVQLENDIVTVRRDSNGITSYLNMSDDSVWIQHGNAYFQLFNDNAIHLWVGNNQDAGMRISETELTWNGKKVLTEA
jgi:hypothetical protein